MPSMLKPWLTIGKISFRDHHQAVLHLIPTAPSRVLDVGAGMGRDTAALAALGHSVVAVEPVDELRAAVINFYPVPASSGSTTVFQNSASSGRERTRSTLS